MTTPTPAPKQDPTNPTAGLRLGDVDALVREHPAFSTQAVRTLIHRSKDNGLDAHLYRIGRKVCIDLNGFERWVRERNEVAA